MKKNLLLIIFVLGLVPVFRAQDISAEQIKKHISYLASDKLKGRGTSSRGEKKAAKYIAKQFKSYGLQPKGTKGFYQEFTFKKNPNPHDTSTAAVKARKGMNVAAYLDNGAATTVVIGGHYDHLGLGHDKNSLDAKPDGKIHNGADDNASGTAGVLELARYFSTNKEKEKFNFLFITFSGEELGLYGSKYFCENPTIDLKSVNYMINMDMIGRLNDTTMMLMIYGVGTSPSWVPMIDRMRTKFRIKRDSAGIGPSDQTSFYLKDIPVLHFFTGQHSDYHKPTDDIDKINFEGEKLVLEYITNIIYSTDKEDRLVFQKTKSPEQTKSNFKVTLGIMPDYTFDGKGVRADGVMENRPAEKAGIQKGDVIVKLGEYAIENMQDYMKALSKFEKGKSTTVVVVRNNKELSLTVTF